MADLLGSALGAVRRLFFAGSREDVSSGVPDKSGDTLVRAPEEAPAEVKSGSDLLPKMNGATIDFFSSDGGRTMIELNGANVSFLFAAYWYAAIRWRAQKLAEAPLMVVTESQKDGTEQWVPNHPLAELLDAPALDYDMGELIERTSRYIDNYSAAIWTIDRDRVGNPGKLTPFHARQFRVESTSDRLYGRFIVQVAGGPRTYAAEDICYFPDSFEGWNHDGKSRLDVAMNWLALGEQARITIRDLLKNAIWPSAVAMPDAAWQPTKEMFDEYKQGLKRYAKNGNKGEAIAMLGGGRFEILTARVRDLVPEELLNRVESVVSVITGVPAIVLQFQVGMENSPWSQMEQARRMAYDDVIQPAWTRIEKVLTRQLLRPIDSSSQRFVRFDRSKIPALQLDRQKAAVIARAMGLDASLNERRTTMGLEPSPDKLADVIPALEALKNPPEPAPAAGFGKFRGFTIKAHKASPVQTAMRDMDMAEWQLNVSDLLKSDGNNISRIVREHAVTEEKSVKSVSSTYDAIMRDVDIYLRESVYNDGGKWGQVVLQLYLKSSSHAVAAVASEMELGYSQLYPHVATFASAKSSWLITNVADTTRVDVARIVSKGLEAGLTTDEISIEIQQAHAFSESRSKLIARTETTRSTNGGPTEALQAFGKSSGRTFTKTWSGMVDELERDEHLALEGEVKFIDEPFSNGLQYPQEPNCRCQLVYNEVTE